MMGFAVAAVVILVLWALRRAGRMSPQQVRAFSKTILGYALMAAAAFFALHGNFLFAVPAFGAGAGMVGWQKYLQPARDQAQSPPQQAQPLMPRAEALAVLGLDEAASADEIKSAHKRLQRANHPDTGGSTYLAAKINQARDILLKK